MMSAMPPVRTVSAYSQRSGLQLCHRDYGGAEARPTRDAEAAGMAKCSLLAALAKHADAASAALAADGPEAEAAADRGALVRWESSAGETTHFANDAARGIAVSK